MTATRLRLILIVGFITLLAGCGVGGWFTQQLLAQKVVEADHARTDADTAREQVNELKSMQAQLDKNKDIVARASQIAASANQYEYQDQVIKDVEIYANRHGLAVSGYDFNAPVASGSKAPAGTVLTPFSVTLRGPAPYISFLAFLRDMENNLTKIQVTSLTLSPNTKDPKLIENPTLSAVVFIKK